MRRTSGGGPCPTRGAAGRMLSRLSSRPPTRALIRRFPPGILGMLPVALLGGCELQEVTVVDVPDVIVVEAYAVVGESDAILRAFLGRTVGGASQRTVTAARVRVTREDGTLFELEEVEVEECMLEGGTELRGTCYLGGPDAAGLRPGDALALRVELPDGRVLEGDTRIPGDFAIEGESTLCRMEADTPYELRWSRSAGAHTYVNETVITGLDEALGPEGIEAPRDLYLLGLSVSDADTTIVFPAEFGVFERFDLDRPLAQRLQLGLPPGTHASVAISAADRNYVNWARGGNFNPSGPVRVPSIRGDGTGVFGSVVTRQLLTYVLESGDGALCAGAMK